MSNASADFEKLGKFYLGKEYDLKQSELQEDLVLYDSKDLVTHGVVLGMTGSGKTGLCISLLEEAAMDNIPAIVIDPKGDIANLMLTFPDFKGSDFRPWINEEDALKKGVSPDEHAENTASMWKKGIGSWGQSPERVKQFKDKVDVNIFTPGSRSGIPVSILSSLEVPPFEVMDDAELLGERIESTVSSLLSLVGVDADPIQSEEAVLLAAIFNDTWAKEQSVNLESLIRHIQKPGFAKIGIMDVDSYYSPRKRQGLAMKFNALLASPGFSTWLEGPPLDIQKMMYQEDGKARISIFSIAHLGDEERMFFVSILLNQMLGWMRSQGGTTSLRALLYMDEIYGYLPPSANPPSKKPMMTMLKQGRAFGLGCLLATQNPVDLDYKALSNIGTWWLGRLQTERDKMRVLDGLEGAAASQDGNFDRKSMEELLAGLGSRVFLMNNVHEDVPVVFHVRWVMSYLRGPLTRRKIKELMDPKRDKFVADEKEPAVGDNPMGMPSAKAESKETVTRPAVPDEVEERFLTIAGESDGVEYRPYLLRAATVFFNSTKCKIDGERSVVSACEMKPRGIQWEKEIELPQQWKKLRDKPEDKVHFDELPGYGMNEKNYKAVQDEFEDFIYRKERLHVFYSPLVKQYSKLGESEGDFRARLAHTAREKRDKAVEALKEKVEKKIDAKEGQLQRAVAKVDKEQNEASSAKMQAGASIVGALLGTLFGRKKISSTTFSRGKSAVGSASRAMKQKQDVRLAESKVEELEEEIFELEQELAEEIRELEEQFAPEKLELEDEMIKPYKKDIDIEYVGILWVPFDERGDRAF